MPFYHVITPQELLDDTQRGEIAAEITRIHTTLTGAPAIFVNVFFQDAPAGRRYTAGKPSATSIILGHIRDGRPIEVRHEMLTEISAMWVRITGCPDSELLVGLQENDATNVMELVLILPKAGQEAAWQTEHRDKLSALGLL